MAWDQGAVAEAGQPIFGHPVESLEADASFLGIWADVREGTHVMYHYQAVRSTWTHRAERKTIRGNRQSHDN